MLLCKKCKVSKDDSEFPFYKLINGTLSHRHVCKACRKQQTLLTPEEYKLRNSQRGKNYYRRNKQKVLNRTSRNSKDRYHNDPIEWMRQILRARIRNALNLSRIGKTVSSIRGIGCSFPFLVSYIESKFQPGMTWENRGFSWHIDHIKPLASFDLRNPAEVLAANHYTNLQPLWAVDNLKKGSKFPLAT